MPCTLSCEACLYKERCGGCTHCEQSVRCTSDCASCGVCCRARPNAVALFDQLAPLSQDAEASSSLRERPALLPNEHYNAPLYIPTLPCAIQAVPSQNAIPWAGIHVKAVQSASGRQYPRVKDGIRKSFRLRPETQCVLHYYAKDEHLERLWRSTERDTIYRELASQQYAFIIAPNFSVYEDTPRFEHLLNIRRSQVIYNEMRAAGLHVVPDISWATKHDLDDWAAQITTAGIKTIAFSVQAVGGMRASGDWGGYLIGLEYLCTKIPMDVMIIGVGLASKERATAFVSVLQGREFSIINSFAYFRSRSGCLFEDTEPQPGSFDTLLVQNIAYMETMYADIRRKEGHLCKSN